MTQREWHGIDGTAGLGYWTHEPDGSLPLAQLECPSRGNLHKGRPLYIHTRHWTYRRCQQDEAKNSDFIFRLISLTRNLGLFCGPDAIVIYLIIHILFSRFFLQTFYIPSAFHNAVENSKFLWEKIMRKSRATNFAILLLISQLGELIYRKGWDRSNIWPKI